ncbi:unnamed protein product [Chilo suppressalis]|uniref:Caspase family p20 domain-containing protein n=1 Tax=Chilo suppressalis TaxID=168631 RepID=A0ABN8B3S8_CHISP|nr:unnamed protein product [Chilo suppressalis]
MNVADENTPSTTGEMADNSESGYVNRKKYRKKKGRAVSVNVGAEQLNESDVFEAGPSTIDFHKRLIDESASKIFTDINVVQGEEVNNENGIVAKELDNIANELSTVSLDSQLKSLPEINEPPMYCAQEQSETKNEYELVRQEAGTVTSQKYNIKALKKGSTTYELENFEKNAMLIFNHENILGYTRKRLGTDQDVKALKETFSKFNFEVTLENDLNKDEIMAALEKFSSQDFTDYGCVAVVVLTHGLKNGLIRAKDDAYSELEIINHFKVDKRPTLITKPKLVIIQACRGSESIKGVPVGTEVQAKIRKDFDEKVEPYTLPVEADMLIVHSSFIGKPAHRHESQGSWFIQSLCKQVNKLAPTLDFESILIEMKRDVAVDYHHKEYNKRDLEFQTNKQMPVTTSTLIRKLYLKRFADAPSALATTPVPQSQSQVEMVSDKSVLDNNNSQPSTPLVLNRPCFCFLEHYEYIKQCLSIYVKEQPNDSTADALYGIACSYPDGEQFNNPKEKLLIAVSTHFDNTKITTDLKYLHRYKAKRK